MYILSNIKENIDRAWQRMLSGRRLDLLNPSPLDIEAEDIAHGLSFLARWNGQTFGKFPLSVAYHSLLVQELFSREIKNAAWQLVALLHDAPEYVIGDMISPVKNKIGPEYEKLEIEILRAVHIKFGLPTTVPKSIKSKIKNADKSAAWIEATQMAGFTEKEADKIFGSQKDDFVKKYKFIPMSPFKTREAFISRLNKLLEKIN